MGQAQACAAYFRDHPAYHRILEQLLQKYRSYGRAAGTVSLPDAAPEECAAARALFGRPFSAPLHIQTAEFEAALQDTPYQGVGLKELLEAYFGVVIQTKRQARGQLAATLSQTVRQVKEQVQSQVCQRWLSDLEHHGGSGYGCLRNAVAEDPAGAERALLRACQSQEWLEGHGGQKVRLAILSAQVTADPHALDGGALCGNLLLHLLAARTNQPLPSAAEQRDALYYACGILCDSISSSVTQVGARLYTEQGEHPAFQAFRRRREACTLTLTNLAGLTAADSPSGKAYLVENQMVFSQLCDQAQRFSSPLICTSGQPQVAVLRLLDLLTAGGTELFYSGDFDGRGLSIAGQLLQRYPQQLRLWHMSVEDYAQCGSDVKLTQGSLALLQGCTAGGMAPLAQAIGKRGYAGYQELLLPQLQKDLTEAG